MALTLPSAFDVPIRKENWVAQLFHTESCLAFDGTDDYVSCGAVSGSSSISITSSTGISIAFWIKFPTAGTSEQIFNAVVPSDAHYAGWFVTKDSNDKVNMHWGDDSGTGPGDRETMIGDATLAADTWYFIAVTTDFSLTTTNTKIYTASASAGSVTANSVSNSGTAGVTTPTYTNGTAYFGRIGATSGTHYGKFEIRNFAVWNEEIASNEVTALYNSGKYHNFTFDTGNYASSSNLVGYWEFSRGDAKVKDLIGAHHGTISGAVYKDYTGIGFYDSSLDDEPIYGALLNKPNIRESIDLLKSTAQTGNVNLKIANYKYLGDDFSAELESDRTYINRNVLLYIQPNDATTIADCLKIYTGRLESISHTDIDISISVVAKKPWDNIEIPQTRSSNRDTYFPVAYGDFRPNASTSNVDSVGISPSSSSSTDEFRNRKTLYPIPVNERRGDTLYALTGEWSQAAKAWPHYYEKSIDKFLPLANHASIASTVDSANESYQGGYAVRFHQKLLKNTLFKPVERTSSGTNWASNDNAFNSSTVDTSSSTQYSSGVRTYTDDEVSDLKFKLPQLTGVPSKLQIYLILSGTTAFNIVVGGGEARLELINYTYGNEDIIGYFAFTGNGSGNVTFVAGSGSENVTNATFVHSNAAVHTNFLASSSGWGEELVLRFKQETQSGAFIEATFNATFNVFDIFLEAETYLDFSATTTSGKSEAGKFLDDLDYVYCGGDGLPDNGWNSGAAITEIHEAHRDLLHRFTSYTNESTPENWSALNTAKDWKIRYWVNEPKSLERVLEELQYEGGFIFRFDGQDRGSYIHVADSPSTSTIITQDDITDISISTTSFNSINTKYVWEYERHPAKNSYMSSVTSSNNSSRGKYNLESKDNVKKVRLNALVDAPAATAADTNDDIYSYYDKLNGDVKFIVSCTVITPSLYGIDVGDLVKFTGTMPVDPLGAAWTNKVFMTISVQRTVGQIKCKFRGVT